MTPHVTRWLEACRDESLSSFKLRLLSHISPRRVHYSLESGESIILLLNTHISTKRFHISPKVNVRQIQDRRGLFPPTGPEPAPSCHLFKPSHSTITIQNPKLCQTSLDLYIPFPPPCTKKASQSKTQLHPNSPHSLQSSPGSTLTRSCIQNKSQQDNPHRPRENEKVATLLVTRSITSQTTSRNSPLAMDKGK